MEIMIVRKLLGGRIILFQLTTCPFG